MAQGITKVERLCKRIRPKPKRSSHFLGRTISLNTFFAEILGFESFAIQLNLFVER